LVSDVDGDFSSPRKASAVTADEQLVVVRTEYGDGAPRFVAVNFFRGCFG
jgi:hypothetical protein